jgi:CHASE3 domain sensor protein
MDFLTSTTTATSTLYTLTDSAKDLLNYFAQLQIALLGTLAFLLIVLIVLIFWKD